PGLDSISKPSRRIPVPQSSTIVVPLFVRTSTQEVLPPKTAVFGPGVGIEPRVPQKHRCIPVTLSLFRRYPAFPFCSSAKNSCSQRHIFQSSIYRPCCIF